MGVIPSTNIHVSHIQLTYMVINVQDGGGDIYMWELLMCGRGTHVWELLTCRRDTHVWKGTRMWN